MKKRSILIVFILLVVSSFIGIAYAQDTTVLKDTTEQVIDSTAKTVAVQAQTATDLTSPFASLLVLVPLITLLTSLITNHTIPLKGWFKQGLSWFISVVVSLFAWYFKLGMFDGLTWYYALCIAGAAGLAANGLFDVKLVQSIMSSFTFKKRV